MCSKQHIKIKISSARNVNVFWKKTRGAFCAGRDENMRQPAEPASATTHTCRLSWVATSSDREMEALEGPVLGTGAGQRAAGLLLLFISLSCSRARCIPLSCRS